MLNQVILVGRITKIERKETENKNVANMEIAVTRSFKNIDGVYETDLVDVILWDGIAMNTLEYCQKGDVVGVKGRMQTDVVKDDNDEVISKTTNIIAEKLTFLSSKKSGEE